MAGHSKFANIKHRKAAQDKKRGKIFTKIIREITVAVKTGGPDPEANPRLRLALVNARSVNMPKDNIERCIKKASGDGGENYIEVTFEGYGPGGVAIFVECATDNNTRTVSNIRSYFNKANGSLGKDGCLQFIFERKGVFQVKQDSIKLDEDEFQLEMIDAGAEDVELEEGLYNVTCPMEEFGNIQKKFEELKIDPEEGGLQRIPTTMSKPDEDIYKSILKLVDVIEEDDDVQKVYHNLEYDEAIVSAFS